MNNVEKIKKRRKTDEPFPTVIKALLIVQGLGVLFLGSSTIFTSPLGLAITISSGGFFTTLSLLIWIKLVLHDALILYKSIGTTEETRFH